MRLPSFGFESKKYEEINCSWNAGEACIKYKVSASDKKRFDVLCKDYRARARKMSEVRTECINGTKIYTQDFYIG